MEFSITLQQFLGTVVTTTPVVEQSDAPVWFHLYVRGHGHSWLPWPFTEQCMQYLDTIVSQAQSDVYFSPHLYLDINPTTLNDLEDAPVPPPHAEIAPTRTLAVDIDNADLMYLPLIPTSLVRTSPARHQVYFVFDEEVTTTLSRNLILNIEGSDHLSYRFGHMFRLPFTYNYKYNPPHAVHVVQNTYTVSKLEDLIPANNAHRPYDENDLVYGLPEPPDLKPQAYLEELQLSPSASISFNTPSVDPRSALIEFITEMIHKKLPRNNIFFMANLNANNHFKTLAYNQEYELAKLIAKLETAAAKPDMRGRIRKVRNTASTIEERHELVADVVCASMVETGTFHHTKQGNFWYISKTGTVTVHISKNSSSLHYYLNNTFGLNVNDWDTPYAISQLEAFTSKLPKRATETKLSFYSRAANRMLMFTGAGQVYAILPNGVVANVQNGDYGVLFHSMQNIFVPFVPHPGPLNITRSVPDGVRRRLVTTSYDSWNEALFGPFLDNIDGLTHDEAKAILSAWMLFLFFKSDAPSRPLLAIFGQPGAGKSTVLKRVSRFLYGKQAGLVGITTGADYDQQAYEFPLLIIDNVDTWEKWLPDRLAQSAGAIDTSRKKLYSDDQTVILTKDAMIALTAHDPKFSRADIADRLLILRKLRFDSFEDEAEIMAMPRSAMWYDMMRDISKILGTPRPNIPEQLRIQDFASIGSWISAGIGLLAPFQSALTKLRGSQRTFALDTDQVLLDACIAYVTKSSTTKDWKPAVQLYNEMELMYGTVGDPIQFQRKYKTPSGLQAKLFAAQDALSEAVVVEQQRDEFGRQVWRVMRKE